MLGQGGRLGLVSFVFVLFCLFTFQAFNFHLSCYYYFVSKKIFTSPKNAPSPSNPFHSKIALKVESTRHAAPLGRVLILEHTPGRSWSVGRMVGPSLHATHCDPPRNILHQAPGRWCNTRSWLLLKQSASVTSAHTLPRLCRWTGQRPRVIPKVCRELGILNPTPGATHGWPTPRCTGLEQGGRH